ncbi:MAG: hypothetical protein AAF559_09535 [Pseudomonadota bacterium]
MIDSEREALIDQVTSEEPPLRHGGPLAMLGLVLAAWISGRMVLWENPFPSVDLVAEAAQLLAKADADAAQASVQVLPDEGEQALTQAKGGPLLSDRALRSWQSAGNFAGDTGPAPRIDESNAFLAQGHDQLWRVALTLDGRGGTWRARRLDLRKRSERQAAVPVFPGAPPFVSDDTARKSSAKPDRWSFGAWAFLREGSGAAPIAQGRIPVYGASQIGANLQYRADPSSKHDPRLYARAYRALIDEPESEIAAGVSARPVGAVPVRVAAELRYTDNRFRSEVRPAAYAITEFPPVSLPLGARAEVYAGAGYVGGEADTVFFDGQAAVIREVTSFDLQRERDVRVSLGAGAWGGAQRDANRVDVGPTMRVDMMLGAVPARISVDYRERVGGDASPVSGVAATLSTQF